MVTLYLGIFCLSSAVQADVLKSPSLTVESGDVFSGPAFTLTQNYSPTALLSIQTIGTVDLASGRYITNAAGIVVAPAITNRGNTIGTVSADANSGFHPYGSLLIGNNALGFHTIFPVNASTGLGSTAPPTALAQFIPLNQIFTQGNFTGLTSGTTLEFRVTDSDNRGNSGSFLLSPVSQAAAPEPASLALLLPFAAVFLVRKSKSLE